MTQLISETRYSRLDNAKPSYTSKVGMTDHAGDNATTLDGHPKDNAGEEKLIVKDIYAKTK